MLTNTNRKQPMPTKKPATKSTKAKAERAVMVTTAHRGVFFGYASDTSGETIKLRAGRNILYWSADCKGFMGLAATGPTKSCRVGPAANIEIRNITSVTEVSSAAETAWVAGPWA
jgi:hypothetical protein